MARRTKVVVVNVGKVVDEDEMGLEGVITMWVG